MDDLEGAAVMTNTPRKWIESATEVVIIPARPIAEWTDAEIEAVVSCLNVNGLRRMVEAQRKAMEQEPTEEVA